MSQGRFNLMYIPFWYATEFYWILFLYCRACPLDGAIGTFHHAFILRQSLKPWFNTQTERQIFPPFIETQEQFTKTWNCEEILQISLNEIHIYLCPIPNFRFSTDILFLIEGTLLGIKIKKKKISLINAKCYYKP